MSGAAGQSPDAFVGLEHWSDARLTWTISAVLLALASWPLLLVELPPLQDLPNHLVSVEVIQHPERYPDLVVNGFLKTNSPFFLFVATVGEWIGNPPATRIFVFLILALNAWIYPLFVLRMTGSRGRMIVASSVLWAMVHHWYISMGMLNWSLALPIALATLLVLDRQRRAPTLARGVGIALLVLALWYCHALPLMIVGLLVVVHVLEQSNWMARWHSACALLLPFVPGSLLIVGSLVAHFGSLSSEPGGGLREIAFSPPLSLFAGLWARWFAGFSALSLLTGVASTFLLVWGAQRRRESPPFFTYPAMLTLLGFFACAPFWMASWGFVNARFVPFLWFGALLRVPETLSRRTFALLGACALASSVILGVDYVRLDRDAERFKAGMHAVKQGTTLLPLMFARRESSLTTSSLLHAWGFYAIEKQTQKNPLFFGHSRSFPVSYRERPPVQFEELTFSRWPGTMKDPTAICLGFVEAGVFIEDCQAEFEQRWATFWEAAIPRYEQVLLYRPTPEVLELLPSAYRVVHESPPLDEGEPPSLLILDRIPGWSPEAPADAMQP